jgi:hypothetical protein
LKEALASALTLYNQDRIDKTIIETTESYKIRLSKKSGLPDMDLPSILLYYIGIGEKLRIREANYLNYSVIIEDKHYYIKPKLQYLSTSIDDSAEGDKAHPLLGVNKSNKKCCLSFLFKK